MHVFGAFKLDIQPGTSDNPAGVRITLLRYTRGEDSRLLITPECTSFEELEGQINALQHELDEIRERARERFRLHEASVCLVTSFLPDGWIVLALPSGKPNHETRPVLLHGKSVLDGLAAHGPHEPA
jgi:hypothetical protein